MKTGIAMAALTLLAACGGGGGAVPSNGGGAAGLWKVTTSDNRDLPLMILDNGQYFGLYTSPVSDFNSIGGGITGNLDADDAREFFNSGNGRDFNLEGNGLLAFGADGSYVPKQSLTGQITYDDGSQNSFFSSYDTGFDQPANLAALSGNYTGVVGSDGGQEDVTINIDTTGNVIGQGQSSGCIVTGVATPHAAGNVFDLAIIEGASPCLRPGERMKGVVWYQASSSRLFAFVVNGSRDDALLVTAQHPKP